MQLPRSFAVAACLGLMTTAACTVGPAPIAAPDSSGLAPSFAPTELERGGQGEKRTPKQRAARGKRTDRERKKASAPSPDRTTPAPAPSQKANPARESAPAAAPQLTASVTDPRGDVAGTLEDAPAYADIVTARLTRTGNRFELRIGFAELVPQRQPDEDRVLNVASFYDIDGDGSVDYEVWASLADDGWGPSYRDNVEGRAAFMDDSGVRVAASGHDLVFTFPASHLADARSLQWATGSEWGSLEAIATGTAAYEHAPDAGSAAFPQ